MCPRGVYRRIGRSEGQKEWREGSWLRERLLISKDQLLYKKRDNGKQYLYAGPPELDLELDPDDKFHLCSGNDGRLNTVL
jgi:hypothetical protein